MSLTEQEDLKASSPQWGMSGLVQGSVGMKLVIHLQNLR